MSELIVLVGLSGSGKSTFACNLSEKNGYLVVSSDQYREVEYGDEKIQGDNQKLFSKIHDDIFKHLSSGRSVIFDATNLNYKHRIQLLQKMKKTGCSTKAIVMATPFEDCVYCNKGRKRKVEMYVISNQRKTFTFPSTGEGFDKIEIVFGGEDKEYLAYSLDLMYENMMGFEQDNPHHKKDLFGHTRDVVLGVGRDDLVTHLSAVLHDVGKLLTKGFRDGKGNVSEHAHYYSHENVSAYEAMFYLMNLGVSDDVIMDTCLVIQNHMRLHGDVTPKTLEKLEKIVGKKNLERLKVLNLADTDGK